MKSQILGKKNYLLGVLSERTEKQWTAAYLWQSPAAHSACQLPSNDLEAMSASLSAITTANGKWVGEGRWRLPEAPSNDQGCCPKGISRAHCLQMYKDSLQVRFLRLQSQWVVVHRGLCLHGLWLWKSSHWFRWIRVSEWWRGVDCQLVVVILLKWNANGKEPVISDCYWTYGTGSCSFFCLNKDIGDSYIYRICGFFSSTFSKSRYVGHKISGNYFDSIHKLS